MAIEKAAAPMAIVGGVVAQPRVSRALQWRASSTETVLSSWLAMYTVCVAGSNAADCGVWPTGALGSSPRVRGSTGPRVRSRGWLEARVARFSDDQRATAECGSVVRA